MEMSIIDQGKKKTWRNVETGTLVFGYYFLFKAVVILGLAMAGLVSGPAPPYHTLFPHDEHNEVWKRLIQPYVRLVLSLSAIIFSLLLIIGVKKQKTALILTFFIYGLILVSLYFVLNILMLGVYVYYAQIHMFGSRIGILFLHTISIVGLVVVFKCYKKLILQAAQSAHSRFENA